MNCPHCKSAAAFVEVHPRQPVYALRPPNLIERLRGRPGLQRIGTLVVCCACHREFAYTAQGCVVATPQAPRPGLRRADEPEATERRDPERHDLHADMRKLIGEDLLSHPPRV